MGSWVQRFIDNLGGERIVDLDVNNSGVNKIDNTTTTYNVSIDDEKVDKLVNSVYKEWMGSEERELMLEGIKYYNNETIIGDKQRFTHHGVKGKETSRLSNAQINKNFMRKLTRQKSNYILGKQYSIETEDENYLQILEDIYFTKNMYRLIYNLLQESIKEGINWLNVYYDEKGELKFRRVPGNQVRVFWVDREHTEIAQLIHYYDIKVYEGEEIRTVTYADYYTQSSVTHFVKRNANGFERDNEKAVTEGHFELIVPVMEHTVTVDSDGNKVMHEQLKLDEDGNPMFEAQQVVWNKLPWIPLKYNEEEKSLLQYVKSYQDAYEKLISIITDIVVDIPDAIKVFKGYGGADLQEITNMISEYRGIILDIDGDVSTLETKFDPTAINTLLDRLRTDAYEDGAGVDIQSDNTGDKSGTALKFLYGDLDLDSEQIEQELNVFFEWLLFFIDIDILAKNKIDYTQEEVTFKFNKSLIINESEKIDMINKSRDMIPDSMLYSQHPLVDDVSTLEEAIKKEQQEEEKRMNEQIALYNENQSQPAGSLISNPSATEIKQ